MIKGITCREETVIKNILQDYPCEFYYYGSRVKGNFTRGSDLDILIKYDSEISQAILDEIDLKFNKSILPYKVNFALYNKISTDFYKLIKNDLVKVF